MSFGIKGLKYTRHIVLPAITPAVVAGANLAWSDGWFFMIAAEYVQYQNKVVSPHLVELASFWPKPRITIRI
jgi:ABC-type nitrate/sulfonate/bicarbonate transport system permease component